MGIKQNNTKKFTKLVNNRMRDGILFALSNHADYLKRMVATKQVVAGKNRSEPGEYPARETGQLQANITYAFDEQTKTGKVGSYWNNTPIPQRHRAKKKNIGGWALWWLEKEKGRKGVEASWEERAEEIKQDIIIGSKPNGGGK